MMVQMEQILERPISHVPGPLCNRSGYRAILDQIECRFICVKRNNAQLRTIAWACILNSFTSTSAPVASVTNIPASFGCAFINRSVSSRISLYPHARLRLQRPACWGSAAESFRGSHWFVPHDSVVPATLIQLLLLHGRVAPPFYPLPLRLLCNCPFPKEYA